MTTPKPRKILIVERPANWLVDQADGFSRFGTTERLTKRAAKIRVDDKIYTYLSGGVSSFADIRVAVAPGFKVLRHGGDYDSGFPYQISTKPILVLSKSQWVKIHRLLGKLEFLSHLTDWRQALRTNLRELSDQDAGLIEQTMRRAFMSQD